MIPRAHQPAMTIAARPVSAVITPVWFPPLLQLFRSSKTASRRGIVVRSRFNSRSSLQTSLPELNSGAPLNPKLSSVLGKRGEMPGRLLLLSLLCCAPKLAAQDPFEIHIYEYEPMS